MPLDKISIDLPELINQPYLCLNSMHRRAIPSIPIKTQTTVLVRKNRYCSIEILAHGKPVISFNLSKQENSKLHYFMQFLAQQFTTFAQLIYYFCKQVYTLLSRPEFSKSSQTCGTSLIFKRSCIWVHLNLHIV